MKRRIILFFLILILFFSNGCAHYATMQVGKYENRQIKSELLEENAESNKNFVDGHALVSDLIDLWDWETFKKHPYRESFALLIDLTMIYFVYREKGD